MRFGKLARNYERRHTGPSAASATARNGRGSVGNLDVARAIHARRSAGVQSDSFKVTTRCHVPRVLHDTTAENHPSRPWMLASNNEARNKLACPARGIWPIAWANVVWYWNRMVLDTKDIFHRPERAPLFYQKRLVYFDVVAVPCIRDKKYWVIMQSYHETLED